MTISSLESKTPIRTAEEKAQKEGDAKEIQNRFLTLLTAQLRNQDPLKPLENSEITGQMAQLSTVTGIESLNQTMNDIKSSLAGNLATQANTLIGRSVSVETNSVSRSSNDEVTELFFETDSPNVTVSIRSPSGALVFSQPITGVPEGFNRFDWTGINNEGAKVPAGEYSVTFTDSDTEQKIQSFVLADVVGVQKNANAGLVVITENGDQIPYEQINGVF